MSDANEIEVSIEHAKQLIELRNMALKLSSNREFKKIVLEGYFKDEAVRLTNLSGDANMIQHRDEIFISLQAISMFRQYMSNLVRMGDIAAAELSDYEAALEEERAAEIMA